MTIRHWFHTIALVAVLLVLPAGTVQSQSPTAKPPTGKLRGVVYDSVRARPLPLATIQLVSATDPSSVREIIADSLGRFTVDSVPPGSWIVGATHPWMDSLAVEQLAVPVEIKAKGTTRVVIAVPSEGALVARVCGAAAARDSSSYIHGMLRRANSLGVGTTGTVRVQWVELTLTKEGVQRSVEGMDVQSTPDGRYVACGVPRGGLLRVRSWSGNDSTGVLDIALAAHGIARMDLAIGEAQRTTMSIAGVSDSSGAPAVDSVGPMDIEVLRGAGSIQGVIRSVARGNSTQPLANARITVWGSGLEVRSAAKGRFALSGLPTGSYILETVAIGYQPVREVVELRPDTTVTVETCLDRLAMLDTVQVRAMRRRLLGPSAAGFEERRQRGFGKFLGPEDLERRVASRASDLFRMIAGVRIVPGPDGDRVMMRGDFRGSCVPTMFLDGMRILDMGGATSINAYVSPMEIRAIEVYVSGAATPPEFSNGLSTCGSVVIWTGARR